jgi:Protein of unknown function (DUF1761)
MNEITTNVSWLAVIVGAVLSFLLGYFWYSPMLFGTKWAEGSGVKMNTADKMPMDAMAAQGIGLLLMSWFVGVTAANNALWTVILATLAFTVLGFSGNTFSGKSSYARWVDAGYWIAALVIMIIVQGIL